MSDQPKPAAGEWTVHQWRDGAGELTSSYEIHEGYKVVVADLLKDECEQIADAHNAALAEQKRDLWQKISLSRMEADNWKGLYEKSQKQLAAEQEKVQTLVDALKEIANGAESSGDSLRRYAANALALAKVEVGK